MKIDYELIEAAEKLRIWMLENNSTQCSIGGLELCIRDDDRASRIREIVAKHYKGVQEQALATANFERSLKLNEELARAEMYAKAWAVFLGCKDE